MSTIFSAWSDRVFDSSALCPALQVERGATVQTAAYAADLIQTGEAWALELIDWLISHNATDPTFRVLHVRMPRDGSIIRWAMFAH